MAQHDTKAVAASPGIAVMPPLILYACLLSGGLLEWLFPSHVHVSATLWRVLLGALIGGAGFQFMMHGHRLFRRLGTNVRTNRPATQLVTHGTYRYSRNPMYTGMTAFFVGIALAAGSLWLLAGSTVLWLYLALYVVPREEAYMRRTFGSEYEAYCAEVRRWL